MIIEERVAFKKKLKDKYMKMQEYKNFRNETKQRRSSKIYKEERKNKNQEHIIISKDL